MSELVKIHFLSSKVHSCFFYLNEYELRNSRSIGRAIKIKFGPDYQNTTFGCISSTPLAEVPNGHIGISSLCGSKFGLKENELVVINYCDVDSVENLQILPKKEEDYVILLSCKSILETYLLNQVSVVAEGQVLPVYVFSNISIDIEIGKLNLSSSYGKLEKFTEITVLHPSEKSETKRAQQNDDKFCIEEETEGTRKYMKIIFKNLDDILGKKIDAIQIDKERSHELILRNLVENRPGPRELIFKIQPSFLLDCDLPEKIINTCVIVSNFKIENGVGPYCTKILARVQKALSRSKEKVENDNESTEECVLLNVFVISLNNDDSKTAFCPPFVMKKLKLQVGSKISVEQLKQNEKKAEMIPSKVIDWGFESKKYLWKSIAEVQENVRQSVINNFKHNYKINTLIVGETGSGKSFFLTDIVNEFEKVFVYCKVIQCKSLRGKKVETLYQLLMNNLKEFIYQEPSLLVLDDLDALTYIVEEEEQFNRHYSNRVVDLISVILENFQRKYNITVIASAAKLTQLSSFVSKHGPVLFQNVVHIPEMSLSERIFMLKSIIEHRVGVLDDNLLDINELSSNLNGYTVQNLNDLVDKALFNSMLRNETENSLKVSQMDFELALTEFAPFNLRTVKLKQNIEINWEDVGGMLEPKKILMEIFSWPLKYPELIESCPLRLQRGVLLYGAPGTGKTMLAGALANKCGLNFISVKGPEVLSKYVGASEEGVRNLFVQAQRSQPSLLFFDEFDSLAPKRGHDSSGVTDRVVNQMLTQLDGVESLNGVWVLAATSRPDLLDPALLRPGRLDKLIFCDTPNQVDRLSILEVLSKKLSKEENVNLSEIAEKTVGYTGADLQAILYNAQMSAIKEVKNSLNDTPDVKVQQEHFLRALSEVKPSISAVEKKRYDKIYEKFLNSRKRNDPEDYVVTQKVTLA